ncbi:MAG: Fe-S cluster assembly protein SufD [Tissierellaceae bacterium]
MKGWKRIGLKDFEFPNILEYHKEYLQIPEDFPETVNLLKSNGGLGVENEHYFNEKALNGIGREFVSLVQEFSNSGISLYLPSKVKIHDPIRLEFAMDEKNPTVLDKNYIVAEAGSEATVIFDYSTDESIRAFHNGMLLVYAKENSTVNIIKVQRMNDKSSNFDTNYAFIEGNGKVNWISVELGSDISGVNYTSYLNEEASQSDLSSIYLGDGLRKMDLSYTMVHRGPRSISNIETRGVLMDKAKKVFRGNLDFKRGARHSTGVEEEYVILLDPTVKSHSIPALLSEEDDVQGEHAASAGQISENKLFYLMSRGLSQRDAKKLIIEASFRPIIEKIAYGDLRSIINGEIERRLINA